jgi:CheY-like chemotaxis protein
LGGTVLVVDDEADLIEVAHTYLAEMGFQTLEAKDGESALAMIKLHAEIGLMVTDIVMDFRMSGVALVEKARLLRPDLKVIYSSGFSVDALAEKGSALAGIPLLRKPYLQAEFAEMVHEVMEASCENQGTLERRRSCDTDRVAARNR